MKKSMLLFYTQVLNPDDKDQKRFNRIKKKMVACYKAMKKEKSETEQLIMKSDKNYFAIHQFIVR